MYIPTTKNLAIVVVANKRNLAHYHLKSPLQGEGHHLEGASLEVVMEQFIILASLNCHNFDFGSKQFLRSGMGTMDCIMTLKDYGGSSLSIVACF